MAQAVLLDVDGTLVDTNYHHSLAWFRAFREHGFVLPVWRIHRHMGVGGDKLVSMLLGDSVEADLGDRLRALEAERYGELIDEVEPFAEAADLVLNLKERGLAVVLASSARAEEVEVYIELLGVRDALDAWTTGADVAATKPDPDLVLAALEKAGTSRAVMVGDTTWDCLAASRVGVPTVTVLTGGFSADELRDAGAVQVYESVGELRKALDLLPALMTPAPA